MDEEVGGKRSRYNQAQLNLKNWDVQIQIGSKIFKSQRTWLASYSTFFHTMFNSEFRESKYTRDQPITLHEIDVILYEEFCHFMYTDEVRVNDFNVLQLLELQDYLGIRPDKFKERCVEHVKRRSEARQPMSNALDLLDFAHSKRDNVLVHILHTHVCKHLYHFCREARLMEFCFEYLSSLLEFCGKRILPLRGSANVLLMLTYNWVNYKSEERWQHLGELTKTVDVANKVSSSFAAYCLRKSLVPIIYRIRNNVKNTKSLPDWEALDKTVDIHDLRRDDAKLSGNISFTLKNVKNLRNGERMYSPSSCIISNLLWKTSIERNYEYVQVMLHCKGANLCSEWNCYANAVFTVISHVEGRDYQRKFNGCHLFSTRAGASSVGQLRFMKWTALVHPRNGYLGLEDSITIETEVHADVPFLNMT